MQSVVRRNRRNALVICTITGDMARILEIAMDKGMDIKFEQAEDGSGDIMLLVE